MTARILLSFLLALIVTVSSPVVARPPVTLSPSTAWTVDYDDDSCRLTRIFGDDGDETAFFFERYEPSTSQFMLVAGRPLRPFRSEDIVQLQFGPAMDAMEARVRHGDLGRLSPAIMTELEFSVHAGAQNVEELKAAESSKTFAQIDAEDAERFAHVDTFAVGLRGNQKLVLRLGDMAEPMAALRDCTRELLTHWGIDVAQHETMTRRVAEVSGAKNWLSSVDYPKGALHMGQEGMVQFRLMVDKTGKPTSCHIQQSTQPKEFDEATCRAMMTRAQFEPALDANGVPMASYFVKLARFRIVDR